MKKLFRTVKPRSNSAESNTLQGSSVIKQSELQRVETKFSKFVLEPSQLKQLKGGNGSTPPNPPTSEIIIEDDILT